MIPHIPAVPARWSTAAFGSSADTSPVELDALSCHLASCTTHRRSAHAVERALGSVTRFVTGRSVTSTVLLVLLLSAVASVVV